MAMYWITFQRDAAPSENRGSIIIPNKDTAQEAVDQFRKARTNEIVSVHLMTEIKDWK